MKTIHPNPIFKKEIRIGARTIKFPLAVMGYAAILSLIAGLVLNSTVVMDAYTDWTVSYGTLNSGFMALAFVQLGIICLIVPVMTASSIAGERERQTLDIMLTAPVSPFSIVCGKVAAAMLQVLLFVAAGLPAMSLCFVYGGFQWYTILYFLAGIVGIAFFVGAVGVWCSSVFKRTIASVIVSFVIEGLFYLAPFVILMFRFYARIFGRGMDTVPGSWALIFLVDPAVGFVDLIVGACYGRGIIGEIINSAASSHIVELIAPCWGWVSLAVTVLLGFLFLWLAARRIDAVRRDSKKRSRGRVG